MAARIAAHRRERPAHWRVREEPTRLAQALRGEQTKDASLILVDCLTLWISNCLWASVESSSPDESGWRREREDFLNALGSHTGDVIIVTNEVGTGIVPVNVAARLFRDEQGWLNQAVAAICDEVFLVVAGLPLRLKPT
jgi:adenosylcobinamide kinase/adenosylcobinamide-phosphate guanylyltransferase